MLVRHARICLNPHLCEESASRHADETSTCLPCTAHSCRERFAQRGRDTNVSALHRTYVRTALCAMQARHARVRSAPHMRAESALRYHDAGKTRTCPPCTAHACDQRFALCRRDTHVSALHRTCVRRALHAQAIIMQARHARVRPAPHIRAESVLRYHDACETRTCPPCTAHTYQERFALCRRDTHVSALHHTYVWCR